MMAEPAGPREKRDGAAPPSEGGAPEYLRALPDAAIADPRLMAAWQEWLRALATDADAALAAAHVYRDLDEAARDAWLDALMEDSPELAVPAVAVYAPLLAVESDPARRARIVEAIVSDVSPRSDPRRARALRGIAPGGERVIALVSPLYLRFVEVLWCRYAVDGGFTWVRHDAILADKDAPADGASLDDVVLEATPITPVIEELAHAVLAQRRHGRALPEPLHLFAHLFDARVDEGGAYVHDDDLVGG
ncbi:hypothetical protein A7982_12459 [Minicystis rosea]|nr:hypothetical protein A7982_12459 [Minicystis rosea]